MRLRQLALSGWIGGDERQAQLTGAACLDHDFKQAGLMRIGAHIEQIDPPLSRAAEPRFVTKSTLSS